MQIRCFKKHSIWYE